MKNLFAVLGVLSLLGTLGIQPALAETGSYLTSFNFTNQGMDGTLAFTCFGERTETGYDEELPNIRMCNGTTEMRVTWNGKTVSQRMEEDGLVWFTPRVINGTAKKLLVIQNNTVADIVGGVGGAPSNATYVFDFGAQKFTQIVNPTGRKLYWNPAGTRALFINNTCAGGGCSATSAIMGLTLTSKQAVALTMVKAALPPDFTIPPSRPLPGIQDEPVQTWKSLRWVTDRVFEAKYLTTSGKTQTLRVTY